MSKGAALQDVIESSHPLLERSDQLAALEAAICAVREVGRGRLMLVSGEAGVGKTSLVRHFCDQRRGLEPVLWGGCDALFTPRPLGPLLDIAYDAGGELESVVTRAAGPHEVAACLLRVLAATGPSILVLEDLHWADEPTLDVLRILAPRLEQTPALIVATFRDDELDRQHPLRLVLGELRAGPLMRRVEVAPLSFEAVQDLARASGFDPVELHRVTAGNPFFLTEALTAAEGAIPRSIRDAVLGRAARLGRGARIVLDAVAVSPVQAELWLLEAVSGASEGLDECLDTGMLVPVKGGLAFRHELARRAVEQAIPPHIRAELHRKAMRALAVVPGGSPDLTRLSHHADGADDADAVLRYAPAAALHAASRGGHREAAAHYVRALRFTGDAPTELRAQLLERLSQEYYVTDHLDDALEAIGRAADCRRELGDDVGLGAALCSLSACCWCAGDLVLAEQAARDAVELLERGTAGHALAMAYGSMSALAMNAEDAVASLAWGTRALELAEQIGDPESLVFSLNNLGTTEQLCGQSSDKLERSLALAEQGGFDGHVGRALKNLCWVSTRTRSYRRANWFDRALKACADRELEMWWLYVTAYRARYELDRGCWSEATDAAALVLRISKGRRPLRRILTLCITGLVRARRGDPDRWAPLDEALALAAGGHDLQWVAPVALARAEAAWLEGQGADAVLDATSEALELAVRRDAHWVTGELLLWRRLAGIEDTVPTDLPEPFALQLAGDWAAAAERWSDLGCPYEAALALGEADDEDTLRRSLAELQALGARPAVAIVLRRLRARGATGLPRGPRDSTRQNPANLTVRELEVLRLVALGLRNSEIAARMFLREKTVGHHVSAVLRKLDVRSRGQVAGEAARLGLLDDVGHSTPAI